MDDFKELKAANVDLDERLTLYLMQNGKCLYSGRAIDLNKLMAGSGEYEVDHIIPRAYIKDDSLENKALVYREENQHKTDQLLIDKSIRWKMGETWKQLHQAKLIGDKKYRNLLRSSINENAMKGFVARQLVETSQMVKMAQALLEARYADEERRSFPLRRAYRTTFVRRPAWSNAAKPTIFIMRMMPIWHAAWACLFRCATRECMRTPLATRT